MNVLDEDIDIAEMKRLETSLSEAKKETKEKLKSHPKSKFLKAKLKCLTKAAKFHGTALSTISHHVRLAKKVEKEADKCEVELLNLPCDLEEGDHVDKCDALKCRKKGLRKRERNAKTQARLWYRMQTLDRRIHRFKQHVAKIKETKSCPHRRVDVFYHNKPDTKPAELGDQAAFAEVDASADSNKKDWVEDWVVCLDRAEARIDAIRRQIARMKAKVDKLKSLAIPLTCGDKAKAKLKFPPTCPKPKLPPPPPLPKKYVPKSGKFALATAVASGDPHTDTFDGVHHDTMIAGWFTWINNPVIHLQGYSQLGCMPANVPNTCLRAMTARIKPPGSDEWLAISWGLWPPQNQIQNIVISDSFGKSINVHPNRFPAGLYLGDKFRIAYQNGQLQIRPHGKAASDPNIAITVIFGAYYLMVQVPRAAPHIGRTNGLLGYINPPGPRRVQDVLRFRDGRPSNVDQKALCQRCGWAAMQTPQIFEWAATHVVTGPKGVNPPISLHTGGLKQQKYINSHHRNRKHFMLMQLDASVDHLDSLKAAQQAEMELAFDPFPKQSKPKTFPNFVPKANREDLQYCRLRLKKVFDVDKLKKAKKKQTKKPWWHGKKCLSEAETKKIKEVIAKKKAVVAKAVAKYHENLNACLQDVKSKSVAKTVIAGQKKAKKEKKHAKAKMKKQIRKKQAKKRAAKRAIKAEKKAAADAEDPNKIAKLKAAKKKRAAPCAKESDDDDQDKPQPPPRERRRRHSHRRPPPPPPRDDGDSDSDRPNDDDQQGDDNDGDEKDRDMAVEVTTHSFVEHGVDAGVQSELDGVDESGAPNMSAFESVDDAGQFFGQQAAEFQKAAIAMQDAPPQME